MLHFIPMQALTYIPSDDATVQCSTRRPCRTSFDAIHHKPKLANHADKAQTRSSRSYDLARVKSTASSLSCNPHIPYSILSAILVSSLLTLSFLLLARAPVFR